MHYADGHRSYAGYGALPTTIQGHQAVYVNPLSFLHHLPGPLSTGVCEAVCGAHGWKAHGVASGGRCTCLKPTQGQTTVTHLHPHKTSYPPVPAPTTPPPVLSENDCANLPIVFTAQSPATNLVRRIERALNYALSGWRAPIAVTGQSQNAALAHAWAHFVTRYATWDAVTQKYPHASLTEISCSGLMLLKTVNAGIAKTGTVFVGPIDEGKAGSTVRIKKGGLVLDYEERDKLWILEQSSRPTIRHALQNLVSREVRKSTTTGNIFVRCVPSSAPIPAGHDALTAMRKRIAQGYAVMIQTDASLTHIVLCYTKHAASIASSCSTYGAFRAAAGMHGFGLLESSAPSLLPAYDVDPAKPLPPNPKTGLTHYALFEPEPPPLIDAARARIHGTGGLKKVSTSTPPGTPVPVGYPQGYPPGYVGSGYPAGYPGGTYTDGGVDEGTTGAAPAATTPAAAAPVAAPTSGNTMLYVGIAGALGLAAYLAFA